MNMVVNPGDEFNIIAAPSQEMMRKLAYLAAQGNDSVLTGNLRSPQYVGQSARGGRADRLADTVQILTQQEQLRQQRIDALNDRLDDLDRTSLEALRQAEERLEDIRRNANRTRDGRLAFEAQDGTIRDEHGHEVSPDEIDPDTLDADAPTYEDFTQAQEEWRAAGEVRNDVLRHKERLESGELSDEELADLEGDIDEIEATLAGSAPGQDQEAAVRSTSAAKAYDGSPSRQGDAPLREPFTGAAVPADTGPVNDPAPEGPHQQPGTPFTPG